MSQVTQKEARGAAHAAAAAAAAAAIVAPLPPATVRPRGGVEPLPLPRAPRRPAQHPGGPRSRQAFARICSLVRSQVPHRRKRQPAARTARAIALGGVFGQALKRPPRPLVSCVAARSLVSGGGAGRVCRATLQQPRCARNQHACCLPSHRAVARRPPPPAFRRAPPDAEACSFSIAAKQERHLANDAAGTSFHLWKCWAMEKTRAGPAFHKWKSNLLS